MHKRKSKIQVNPRAKARAPAVRPFAAGPPLRPEAMVPGPQLRRILGVSAVTLWRWRHDKDMHFPSAKCIQDRLYFSWKDVSAWLAAQQEAA
jgi:hypothetical protein